MTHPAAVRAARELEAACWLGDAPISEANFKLIAQLLDEAIGLTELVEAAQQIKDSGYSLIDNDGFPKTKLAADLIDRFEQALARVKEKL